MTQVAGGGENRPERAGSLSKDRRRAAHLRPGPCHHVRGEEPAPCPGRADDAGSEARGLRGVLDSRGRGHMKRWTAALCLLACACGSGGNGGGTPDSGPGSGSGSFTGTVNGHSLTVRDAVFGNRTPGSWRSSRPTGAISARSSVARRFPAGRSPSSGSRWRTSRSSDQHRDRLLRLVPAPGPPRADPRGCTGMVPSRFRPTATGAVRRSCPPEERSRSPSWEPRPERTSRRRTPISRSGRRTGARQTWGR